MESSGRGQSWIGPAGPGPRFHVVRALRSAGNETALTNRGAIEPWLTRPAGFEPVAPGLGNGPAC